MPTVKVPLFSEVYTNVDGTVLNDKQQRLVNAYIDELRGVNSIPGLVSEYQTNAKRTILGMYPMSTPADGYYYQKIGRRVFCVSGDSLERLDYDGSAFSITTLGTIADMPGLPVRFSTDQTTLLIATGGPLNYCTWSAAPASVLGVSANAPTKSTHVVNIDGYSIANVAGTNRFQWSALDDPTNWPIGNRATAAGNNDIIQAIAARNRELFVLGTETTEIWENVGEADSIFQRVSGGFIECGCIAPYSVVVAEGGIYWLNHRNRFVIYDGKGINQISTPFDRQLSEWSSTQGCIGNLIDVNGTPCIWFSFPGEGRALVFNLLTNAWSERARWSTAITQWEHPDFGPTLYMPEWRRTLFGGQADGWIYSQSSSSPWLEQPGNESMRILHQSGHVDYGTSKRKRAHCLRIRIKRQAPPSGSDSSRGKLAIRWRDDGGSRWSNFHEIDLGFDQNGSGQIVTRLHRTGIFRTRQYEISGTPQCAVIYADADEDIEVLAS